MEKAFCLKHGVGPDDEKWKVLMEELTSCEDEMQREPFKGQVCPLCYLHLKERMKELKRNLKVESREAISLRADNDYYQKVLDAVVLTVKQLTGKDAYELARQQFPVSPTMPYMTRQGDLLNILPNLIVLAANAKK